MHAVILRLATQVVILSYPFLYVQVSGRLSDVFRPVAVDSSTQAKSRAYFIIPDFITGSQIQFDWWPVGRAVLPINARRGSGQKGLMEDIKIA